MAETKKKHRAGLVAVGLCCLLAPRPARGADVPVAVNCVDWPAESAARVEARIRAWLAVEAIPAQGLKIECGASEISVRAEGRGGAVATRSVSRSEPQWEEALLAATRDALREVTEPAAEPAPPAVEPPPPPPPRPPPPLAPSLPAAAPKPPAAPATPPPRFSELGLAPRLARFGEHWALGAAASLATGRERLHYGLTLGVLSPRGLPAAFSASEWSATASLGLGLPLGLRGQLGVGASLLVTSPTAGITSTTSTSLGAAFVGLGVARPLWLGDLALTPSASVRLASARSVRVNERQELSIPVAVPELGLALLYRLP